MNAPCADYATLIADCYFMGDAMYQAQYQANCEYLSGGALEMVCGATCAMAYEDSLACINPLSCMELMSVGQGQCDSRHTVFMGHGTSEV